MAKQASRQSDDHDLRVLTFSFMGYQDVAEFGIGLAMAVALDAFIPRTVLVPAAMHLFGDANIVLADATGELATEDVRLIRLSASKHPDETDDLLRLGLHRLPIREFPLLRSLAPALASYDGATELERGLDIVLTGLTDSLTPSAAAQPGPGPAADDLQLGR